MATTFMIPAYAIYKDTHLINLEEIGINVSKIQGYSPRVCWIKRYVVAGQNQVQALLTFEVSSADQLDPNLLQGLYLEIGDKGVVIDCISIDNFLNAADGISNISPRYYGNGGIPAFTAPTPTCYTITRLDDASAFAHGVVSTDYVSQYFGNVSMYSHITGTSIYKVQSYTPIVPIGGDVIGTC